MSRGERVQTCGMVRRITAAVLAVAAVAFVASCGGGSDTKDDSTTSSTASTSTSVASGPTTTALVARPHSLAAIVVQIDDQLRRNVALADACIHGTHEGCTGDAQHAYTTLDDLAGAVPLLEQAVTKGSSFYVGELPDDLVALYDQTLDAGVSAKAASAAAQKACLPAPTATCDEASAALDDAIIELYKDFNEWRKLL